MACDRLSLLNARMSQMTKKGLLFWNPCRTSHLCQDALRFFLSRRSYHLWHRMGLASGVGIRTEYPPHFPKGSQYCSLGQGLVGLPKATWKGFAWWKLSTSQRLHQLGLLGPEKTHYTRMGLARTKQTHLEVLLMCAVLSGCLSRRGLLERGVWWACLSS